MEHLNNLVGAWVEIQERNEGDRIVLMRPDAGVPPSRGGRRKLEMNDEGVVRSFEQGSTDRLEEKAQGDWDLSGNQLHLKIEGWEKEYTVETMTDTELILKQN